MLSFVNFMISSSDCRHRLTSARTGHSNAGEKLNKADRIAVICFLIGATFFGVAAIKDESANILFQTGGMFWVCSYFSIVIDNWVRKTDVSTRNGIVRYKEEPIRYFLSYALVLAFGIFSLVFIIFLMIVS